MKTQTFVRFPMDYSVQIMCPPAKAGALMALLSECTLVTPEYMPKSDNMLVIKEDPLRMDLGTFSVVTKAEYVAAMDAEKVDENA